MRSGLCPSPIALAMATVSLAMHATLVTLWNHPPQAVAQGTDAAPPALRVSLLRPTQTSARSLRPNPFDATSPAAQTKRATDLPASPAPEPTQSAQSTQSAPAVQPESTPGLPLPSTEWAYLPASQLDQRPSPEAEIVLPFPEGETLARGARVNAVLVLYVNEDGTVDRIEFGQSGLPSAFARVAVESFARVRMRPGIKNGRARRAMMKIEVEFEAPVSKQAAAGAVLESSRSWQSSP